MPRIKVNSAKQLAALIAAKHGSKRVGLKRKIAGKVIYRNPNAKPVPELSPGQKKRGFFSMENVEWVSLGDSFESGGTSRIHFGKVKFKGIMNPQRVAIKYYLPFLPNSVGGEVVWTRQRESAGITKRNLEETIRRIKKSGVRCPKMAVLEVPAEDGRNKLFLIMELFGKSISSGKVFVSKLYGRGEVVKRLRMENRADVDVLKKIADYTAKLAGASLALSKVCDIGGGQVRIDEFSLLDKKDGSREVILHDIEFMRVCITRKDAWEKSRERLILGLSGLMPPSDFGVAHQIIHDAGRAHGLE